MCEKNKAKIVFYQIVYVYIGSKDPFKCFDFLQGKVNYYLRQGYTLYGDLQIRKRYAMQIVVKYEE